MLLSILWTLRRHKILPQRELGPTFQPALFRRLKITITNWENKIMQGGNEQSLVIPIIPIKALGPLGQVLGNAKQRGSLCPFGPTVHGSQPGFSGPCWHLKGFSRALLKFLPGGSLVLLAFLMLLISSAPHYGALGCFILSLKWELGAQSSICVTVPTSCSLELISFPGCHFVSQFHTWVIWKAKSMKRRPCLMFIWQCTYWSRPGLLRFLIVLGQELFLFIGVNWC